MTKQKCNAELKLRSLTLDVGYLDYGRYRLGLVGDYDYWGRGRLSVYADARPDDVARVATCELEKGHEGRCKATKNVKVRIKEITWWK